ncbi:MAG TPA: EI24 domain-containing protein [Blastocatellia bacterium]|nr:EI24 domain-containing protein [Blastocatellia bacterium]
MSSRIPLSTYNPRAANPVYHFISGLRFFFAGWSLLFRNPALLGLSLIPIALTVLMLIALAFGCVWLVGRMFAGEPSPFGEPLRVAAQALIFLLVLFFGYLLYLPVARVLLAPFSEALSRRAHVIIYGTELPPSGQGMLRAMWEGAKLVALQLVVAVVALIVSLLFPVIGPVIGLVLGSIFCSLDFLDVPLSARGWPLKTKLSLWGQHKSLALGFGIAGYLLLLIPLINLLTLPVGVIGATALAGRIDRADRF